MHVSAALIAQVLATGCGETPDDRLSRMAEESVATQARQNERMAEQSQEVAEASKRLVASDAEARREMIVAQKELQQGLEDERASLDRQREDLEGERRDIAQQRRTDPIIAETIGAIGLILACLLPLLLAAYVLRTLGRSIEGDAAVSELLIEELASDRPRLLPPPPKPPPPLSPPALSYQSPMPPEPEDPTGDMDELDDLPSKNP
jgi:hypothetical protein